MADRRLTPGQKRHDDAAAQDGTEHAGNRFRGATADRSRSQRASIVAASAGETWGNVLSLVVAAGWGITISGTRDGGALSLSLLQDGEPIKQYATDSQELGALLQDLKDVCSDHI